MRGCYGSPPYAPRGLIAGGQRSGAPAPAGMTHLAATAHSRLALEQKETHSPCPWSLITSEKAFLVEKTQRSSQGCDLLPWGLDRPGDSYLCFTLVLMGHFLQVFRVLCSLWVHIHRARFGLLFIGWLGSAGLLAWCLVLEILQQMCFRT